MKYIKYIVFLVAFNSYGADGLETELVALQKNLIKLKNSFPPPRPRSAREKAQTKAVIDKALKEADDILNTLAQLTPLPQPQQRAQRTPRRKPRGPLPTPPPPAITSLETPIYETPITTPLEEKKQFIWGHEETTEAPQEESLQEHLKNVLDKRMNYLGSSVNLMDEEGVRYFNEVSKKDKEMEEQKQKDLQDRIARANALGRGLETGAEKMKLELEKKEAQEKLKQSNKRIQDLSASIDLTNSIMREESEWEETPPGQEFAEEELAGEQYQLEKQKKKAYGGKK